MVTIEDNITDKPVQMQRLVERPVVNIIDKITDKPLEVQRLVEKLVVSIVDKVDGAAGADRASGGAADRRSPGQRR